MSIIPARLRTTIRDRAVELRLCCRVTVAALVTYAFAEFLHLPLALWAVLTAIIVTQLSVGRTLKATIDYFLGALGGAVYSSLVGTLIPHASELGVLAVQIGRGRTSRSCQRRASTFSCSPFDQAQNAPRSALARNQHA